jgi:hypothetical protein
MIALAVVVRNEFSHGGNLDSWRTLSERAQAKTGYCSKEKKHQITCFGFLRLYNNPVTMILPAERTRVDVSPTAEYADAIARNR